MSSIYTLVLVALLANPQGGIDPHAEAVGHGSKTGCEIAAEEVHPRYQIMKENSPLILGFTLTCVPVSQDKESPVYEQKENTRSF